jgi:hypothetical protein
MSTQTGGGSGSSSGQYGLPTYQPNQRAFPGAWNMNQQPTLTAGGTGNWNTGMAQGNAMITGQGPQWAGENLGYYMNQPQNSNPANYGRWNWQTVSPYPAPSSGYPQPGGGGQPYYPPQQPGVPLPPGQGGQPGGQPQPGQPQPTQPNNGQPPGGGIPLGAGGNIPPRPQYFSPMTPQEQSELAAWDAKYGKPSDDPRYGSMGQSYVESPAFQAAAGSAISQGQSYSQSPEYQAMMARVNALGL